MSQQKVMKIHSILYTITLTLFIIGSGILFLLRNGLFETHFGFLKISFYITLFLIAPFITLTVINLYLTKQNKKKLIRQNKQKFESLSKYGIRLEIQLNDSSLIIKPYSPKNNTDVEYIKETLGLTIVDIFKPKQPTQEYCLVKIKYAITDSIYYKTFPLPFNKENALIVLGIQEKVVLYYDAIDNRNSILDLRFLRVHNLTYI